MSDDALLAKLDALIAEDSSGILETPEKPRPVTEVDRLVKAFGEVNDFVEAHGREPDPDTMDIAERKLGARLVGIRASQSKVADLEEHDVHGLLTQVPAPTSLEDILAGGSNIIGDLPDIFDTSTLPARKHPDDSGDRATRVKAKNFEQFADLFKQKHEELNKDAWQLSPFAGESTIREGRFFLIKGLMCFVAEVHDPQSSKGEDKPRLRVIFENGTESSMYRESLANRLYETGGQALARTSIDGSEIGDADIDTGYVYVLRSLSEHPDIRGLSNLHKIGFTRGSVEKRIAGAENSPTYFMAPVEVAATYRVYNVRPSALEHLLHKVFAGARLNANIVNEAGGSVDATEWFLVPLPVIDRAIELITSGDIVGYAYDPSVEELLPRG